MSSGVRAVEKTCHASSLLPVKLSPPFGVYLLQCLSVDVDVTPTRRYPPSAGPALKVQTDVGPPKQAE